MIRRPPRSTLSLHDALPIYVTALALSLTNLSEMVIDGQTIKFTRRDNTKDRKSTRLNSSHTVISYAVFCLKKKKQRLPQHHRDNHTKTLKKSYTTLITYTTS